VTLDRFEMDTLCPLSLSVATALSVLHTRRHVNNPSSDTQSKMRASSSKGKLKMAAILLAFELSGWSTSEFELTGRFTPDLELNGWSIPDLESNGCFILDLELSDWSIPDLELSGRFSPDLELSDWLIPDLELSGSFTPDLELSCWSSSDLELSVKFSSNLSSLVVALLHNVRDEPRCGVSSCVCSPEVDGK
jgi:hypothetical protein